MPHDTEISVERSHPTDDGQRQVHAGRDQRQVSQQPQPVPDIARLPTTGELVEVQAATLVSPGAAGLAPELEWTVVDLVATWGYRHW